MQCSGSAAHTPRAARGVPSAAQQAALRQQVDELLKVSWPTAPPAAQPDVAPGEAASSSSSVPMECSPTTALGVLVSTARQASTAKPK